MQLVQAALGQRAQTGRGRVLVTDLVNGRSRSAVAAVRALAAGGYAPVVTTSAAGSPAASSRDCAAAVPVPAGATDDAGPYVAAVRQALAATAYVGVVPASDGALLALGLPGGDLLDKSALPDRVATAGLRVPKTLRFEDGCALAAAAGGLTYPLVVKPVLTAGPDQQARRVETPRDLELFAGTTDGPSVVQPYLGGDLQAVSGVVHEGAYLALVHQRSLRTWPADCGVASAAVTTAPDPALEERLAVLLAGHRGVFQVQLVAGHVIDVNPRVYGSLPLAVAAGANLPAIACAADGGRVGPLVRGRPGVRYRWLEGDVRSVLSGLRQGTTGARAAAAALRPRSGTAHSVESLRDPGPLLGRLAHVARRGSR